MPEASLYPAFKRFLEEASSDVKGEVNGCDIVAVRAGQGLTLTIVEMKLGFALDLLLQVTDRMRAMDEVWLAVPAPIWMCQGTHHASAMQRITSPTVRESKPHPQSVRDRQSSVDGPTTNGYRR
jgi:hypothetical protein